LFEKILISIDFSEESRLLLNCLDEFRSFGLKKVILSHIVDIRAAGGNASAFVESNEKKLEEIKEEIEKEGIDSQIIVNIGFPAEEIDKIARDENASLILIGSHGRGFIKSFFLGSTAFDLLRITDTPLLIERFKKDEGGLRPYCSLKFPKVLAAIDFSECSSKLVETIGKNKNSFKELFLVHVIERAFSKKEFDKAKENAEAILEEIKASLSGIEVYTQVKAGDAAKSIIESARDEEASLIMLSKKGRGGAKDLFLGSTARDVALRSTKNAVLVVPCGI